MACPRAVALACALTTAWSSWLRLISKPLAFATTLSGRRSLMLNSEPELAPADAAGVASGAAARAERAAANSSQPEHLIIAFIMMPSPAAFQHALGLQFDNLNIAEVRALLQLLNHRRGRLAVHTQHRQRR